MKRRVFLGLPVILGILFYIWYIFHASDNVAYSDYIRLINSYLPDVTNPAKFFVPDILTRVPITYLGRIINVKLFGYNAYFDMILGVLSLGAGAAVLALYAERNRSVGYLSFLLIQFVYFSLNKWEMMTNGTGWVCTLSISGFLFHFAVLDHAAATRCRNMSDRVLLAILPILLVVLVAGPYSGGYAVILVLAYGALWLADRRGGAETSSRSWSRKCRRTWCIGALTTVLAMVLYLWSNSQAVYVHRGAVTDVSIAQEFAAQPLFFLRFLLKAVASSVIGVAQIQELEAGSPWFVRLHLVYLLGLAVFVSYLLALYLNVRFQLYKKTIELIIKGVLKENDQLPSVRSLAKEIGVNPNTVAKAYQELERNKIIYSVSGRGSFIANVADSAVKDYILEDFDLSVNEALRIGITKEELKKRIDGVNV